MMREWDSMEQVVRGRMGQVLGWAGALLLVAGSLVAYPYIASRLAAAPVAWTPTASPSVPCPTAISPTPTDLPTMTSGPVSYTHLTLPTN